MSKIRCKKFLKEEIKRRRKYNKLTLCTLWIGVGISSINLINGITSFGQIAEERDLSSFDIAYQKEFLEEQGKIEKEDLVFENKELEEILKKKIHTNNLTFTDLRCIRKLSLVALEDNNLSDLKYISNLEELTLVDMQIDAEDLEFNQNLKMLTISESKVENTFFLPNTIENLVLVNSEVTEEEFLIPYQTARLFLVDTYFNNLHLKNPQNLKFIQIKTFSLLDLDWLKECNNLKNMIIKQTPNIINTDRLLEFMPNCKIELDEYCLISIPTPTLEKIYEEEKEYVKESMQLDIIADTLSKENMTDEEKVYAITLYILKKHNYDYDYDEELAKEYNQRPFYYALNQEEFICINYACLFSALANRMGLSNYQYCSRNHAWNEVVINGEKRQVDTTFLDNSTILYAPIFSATGKINCYEDSSPSTYYLQNGAADSLVYYLFTEEMANKQLSFVLEDNVYKRVENPILNKTIELRMANENLGFLKEANQTYKLPFISLGITFYIMYVFQRQKCIGINLLREEEREEIEKKLRRRY